MAKKQKLGWQFGRLGLTNVVYFTKAELDLDYVGVTVIKGLNKNSRLQRKTRNGVGKSLLVSALANIVRNSAPAITSGKRNSGAKSSLLVKPNSAIDLEVTTNGSQWGLKKYRDKSASVKYKILEDGKDMQFPTATKAEAYIDGTLFPITDDEFYSYIYLHGTRTFPLQMGTSTERMQFFSSMFHLEKFDLVRAACNARKAELRDSEIRITELRKQLSAIDKEVGEVDVDMLRARSAKYQARIDKLERKASSLHKRQRIYTVYKTHAEAWEKLDKSVPLKKQLKQVSRRLDELDAQHKAWRKYERHLDELNGWKKGYAKATDRVGKLTLEKCQRKIAETKEAERTARRALDALREPDAPDHVEMATFDPADYGLEGDTHKAWIIAADKERARFEALIGLQKQINKIGAQGGKCFVCGAKGGKIEDHLSEYERQAKRWRKAVGKIEAAREWAQWVVDDTNYKLALAEYKRQRKNLTETLDKLPDVSKYEKALKYLEWLDENPKPKWEGDVPEQPSTKARDKLVAQRSVIKTLLPVEDQLIAASEIDADELKQVDAEYASVRSKLSKAVAKKAEITPRIEAHGKLTSAMKRLRVEIKDIEVGLEDAPILDSLIDIYSKNGRKLEVMKQFALSLEHHMNANAPLVFPEAMRFAFVVEPNNFSINVTRGRGKDALTSDVRFLSGAESKQFNLCLVKSLLPMIPANRRANIIVLDECDANLSEAAKDLYVNDFIPALQKVVPHVLVITPLEDVYPAARVFTVVKDGNESKLISNGIEHD